MTDAAGGGSGLLLDSERLRAELMLIEVGDGSSPAGSSAAPAPPAGTSLARPPRSIDRRFDERL